MQDTIKIRSQKTSGIVLKAIPGHFVKTDFHVNYFLDMTNLKSRLSEASAVARELSRQIDSDAIVDTIVCIDGCEIIGAFLAEELNKAGIFSMNAHKTIYIISPELHAGQLLFRENFLPMIKGKNVLLLLASATTSQTVRGAVQTLSYYGAAISGISAVFSAANNALGIPIKSLFTIEDIPDYKAFEPDECQLCREKQPVDAFANSFGYSAVN